MSALDYILAGIVVLSAIVGAAKGFVNQVGTIAGIILAILACRFFGSAAADIIVTPGTEHEGLYRNLTFVLVFAAVFVAVKLLAGLFTKAISAVHLRPVDRIGGALFSAGLSLLLTSIAINLYLAVAPADRSHFEMPRKPWRAMVVDLAPQVMDYIQTEHKV